MKKFKRFIRNACDPVPFCCFLFFAFWLPAAFVIICVWDPNFGSLPELVEWLYDGSFTLDVKLGRLFYSGSIFAFWSFAFVSLLSGCLFGLIDLIKKRRKGVAAVRDNWLLLYVDDDVYDRLHQMADETRVKMNDFCRMCLEAVDPVELEAARPSDWEVFDEK